jgi:hypothetical protein
MTRTLQLAAAILIAPAFATAAAPDLVLNDAALIAHIRRNDYIFTTALGVCREEKLTRTAPGSERAFEFTALCAARAAQESDCPEYRVRATGTVDSPSWATVRSITLDLKCNH